MDQIYDELRAALHSIWHRRWLALGVAYVVCIAGWLVVALMPNSYESKGRIYVQLYDPVAVTMGVSSDDRQHDIDRVRDTLTSAAHLTKVVNQTRLGQGVTTAKQMEAAVLTLGKNIHVTNDQDNLFAISASSGSMALSDKENAQLAHDIVAKMIDIFHSENATSGAGDVTDTMHFLDQQLNQRQQEMTAAAQRRATFQKQHPEFNGDGMSVVQQLEQDHAEERTLDSDLAAAQSALAVINGQLAGTPQTLAGGAAPMGGAHAQLNQAMGQLSALRAKGYTDDHPDVIAMHNEIASLRAQAAAEGSGGRLAGTPNPAYATLISERAERAATLSSLQSRRAGLETDIVKLNSQQTADPAQLMQAQTVTRDFDVLKQQYDKLIQEREDLRLKGQVAITHDSTKFQVIDPATTPRTPTSPNRPLLLVMVLLAGIASGLGAAFAIGEIRATFATTAKLARATGLPVLGAISYLPSLAGKLARQRQMKHFLVASSFLGVLFIFLIAMEFFNRAAIV